MPGWNGSEQNYWKQKFDISTYAAKVQNSCEKVINKKFSDSAQTFRNKWTATEIPESLDRINCFLWNKVFQ